MPLLLAALIATTVLMTISGFDLAIEERFWSPENGWAYGDMQPWDFLFRFGPWPAYLLGAGGLVLFAGSFLQETLRPQRTAGLFLLLSLLIGPGLLVNTLFKDHWGRPRPRQVNVLGGAMEYHPFWKMGENKKGRSFPSGHASSAFYTATPYFVLRSRRRKAAAAVLSLGILYGVLVGIARMLQGGHFPTDVLWAGGFVFLSAWVLARLLRLDGQPEETPEKA